MKLDELIPEIKAGNRKAFKKLYDGYAPLFKGIAFRYTHDLDSSNDIVQESFIKIFKHIDSFNEKGSFEGWMKRIVVNNCLNYIKREKKIVFENTETLMEVPSLSWNEAIEVISFEEIVSIVNVLPLGYKTVFNLSVFEGYSHKEIAALLGITESASRSQLTKAKIRLKEELKKLNIFSSIA